MDDLFKLADRMSLSDIFDEYRNLYYIMFNPDLWYGDMPGFSALIMSEFNSALSGGNLLERGVEEPLENSVLGSIVPYGVPEDVTAGTAVPNTSPDSWTGTGSAATLPASILNHAQSTLPDGRVLVSGGLVNGVVDNIVYIYDISSNMWTEVASLPVSVSSHGQSTLNDGRVLVSGGNDGNSFLNTVYVYMPDENKWNVAAPIPTTAGINSHGQSTLFNGNVLISGAYNNGTRFNSVYVYTPGSNTWAATHPLNEALGGQGQSTLLNGNVLISGGHGTSTARLNTTYLYALGTNEWTPMATMEIGNAWYAQSSLLDNKVLISGGHSNNVTINAVYIYTPNAGIGSWDRSASLPTNFNGHGQSTLADGRVLVSGGSTNAAISGNLNTAYIYTPAGWVAVGTNVPGGHSSVSSPRDGGLFGDADMDFENEQTSVFAKVEYEPLMLRDSLDWDGTEALRVMTSRQFDGLQSEKPVFENQRTGPVAVEEKGIDIDEICDRIFERFENSLAGSVGGTVVRKLW